MVLLQQQRITIVFQRKRLKVIAMDKRLKLLMTFNVIGCLSPLYSMLKLLLKSIDRASSIISALPHKNIWQIGLYSMKSTVHILLLMISICFNNSVDGMEESANQLSSPQKSPWFLEIIIHLAGFSQPKEKNELMRVCKGFETCLRDRTAILRANPYTVNEADRITSTFDYVCSGDVNMINFYSRRG